MDVILKLLSESLLSFYPAMTKFIKFPVINQLWARLFIYSIISFIFMNKNIAFQKMFSFIGILLAIVTVFHVWTSYVGFKNLESGVSYSIFYLYPLFIILFSGNPFKLYYILPLLGVFILTYPEWKINGTSNQNNFIIGIIAIFSSMISEVWIYFIVKKIGINNKWNILFISYFLPAILVSSFLAFKGNLVPQNIYQNGTNKYLILLLAGNAIIGALGYFLRFYTIDKLSSELYGILSYFGIVMAYIYGWSLNKEVISWQKITGTLIIVLSSIFIRF